MRGKLNEKEIFADYAHSIIIFVGCSSVAKEKEIKEDLTNYSEGDLLEKGEKLKK